MNRPKIAKTNYEINGNLAMKSAPKGLEESIFSNASRFRIAGKIVADIPVEALNVDMSYQRITYPQKLIKEWDYNKCSFLLVNYRADEKKFYVIDGLHRREAAIYHGIDCLPCEVLENLTREEEAKLFATQHDAVDDLTINDKFKANLVYGEENAEIINRMCGVYGLRVSKNGKESGGRVVTALCRLVRSVKSKKDEEKENYLRFVFGIYRNSKWTEYPYGLCVKYIDPITRIYNSTNKSDIDRVSYLLSSELSNINPKNVSLYANCNYDVSASERTRIGLLYNDIVNGIVNHNDINSFIIEHSNKSSEYIDAIDKFLIWLSNEKPNTIYTMEQMSKSCGVGYATLGAMRHENEDLKKLINGMICDKSGRKYLVTEKEINYAKRIWKD
jgi:hypothetical protein